ncbi:MAG: hypothetical protein NW703_10320 [Nitrospiraceae bacterium]
MKLSSLVPAIINALPSGRVEGRKRLQKLVHLLQLSGADVSAEFEILHYGPFSTELASTVDDLTYEGKIKEDVEPVGVYGTYQYVYRLGDPSTFIPELQDIDRALVRRLDEASTVVLEIASTIGFFESSGSDRKDALLQTKEIKPKKAIDSVLQEASKVLEMIEETNNIRQVKASA